MASLAQVHRSLEKSETREYFRKLYGVDREIFSTQKKRYLKLIRKFESVFPGHPDVEICSAPGRTEMGGNHTDHQNGRVLAAAVTLDSVGVASRNNREMICIHSEGYFPLEIRLDDLSPRPEEENSSKAMVRGICNTLRQDGALIGGFDAAITTSVPSGSGISSSASFEILIAQIMNVLFNDGNLAPLSLAHAAHTAEAEYFKKPSGLMDQVISAGGGMAMIDFVDPSRPIIQQVNTDFETCGHTMILTKTGGSHACLTDEYAAITKENLAVARYFGQTVLREVDEDEFQASLPALRKIVRDRAILRAMHFFGENQRVIAEVEALERNEFEIFLILVRESGDSSWKLLQNNYLHSQISDQGIPLALTLSERILGKHGAWRVHGGGFAGTVQAYVPIEKLESYISEMEAVFGSGACLMVKIRPEGASRLPVDK